MTSSKRHSLSARCAALVRVLLVLVAISVAGCDGPFVVDRNRLKTEMEQRSERAASSPAVQAAFDGLWKGVFADPAVKEAGAAMLPAFAGDPELRAGGQVIIGRLGKLPAMQRLVKKLMKSNPGASPEKIGQLVEARTKRLTEGPVADKNMQDAFGGVIARPDVAAAFRRVGERLSNNTEFTSAVAAVVDERMTEKTWPVKLKALNGGHFPNADRATELLLEHAFSEQRLGDFYQRVATLPVVKREVAVGARDAAMSPAFQAATTATFGACVNDPLFQDRAVAVMELMMGDDVSDEDFKASLVKLFETPIVARQVIALVDRMLAEPALGEIGTRTVSGIARDAEFKKAIGDLCDAW